MNRCRAPMARPAVLVILRFALYIAYGCCASRETGGAAGHSLLPVDGRSQAISEATARVIGQRPDELATATGEQPREESSEQITSEGTHAVAAGLSGQTSHKAVEALSQNAEGHVEQATIDEVVGDVSAMVQKESINELATGLQDGTEKNTVDYLNRRASKEAIDKTAKMIIAFALKEMGPILKEAVNAEAQSVVRQAVDGMLAERIDNAVKRIEASYSDRLSRDAAGAAEEAVAQALETRKEDMIEQVAAEVREKLEKSGDSEAKANPGKGMISEIVISSRLESLYDTVYQRLKNELKAEVEAVVAREMEKHREEALMVANAEMSEAIKAQVEVCVKKAIEEASESAAGQSPGAGNKDDEIAPVNPAADKSVGGGQADVSPTITHDDIPVLSTLDGFKVEVLIGGLVEQRVREAEERLKHGITESIKDAVADSREKKIVEKAAERVIKQLGLDANKALPKIIKQARLNGDKNDKEEKKKDGSAGKPKKDGSGGKMGASKDGPKKDHNVDSAGKLEDDKGKNWDSIAGGNNKLQERYNELLGMVERSGFPKSESRMKADLAAIKTEGRAKEYFKSVIDAYAAHEESRASEIVSASNALLASSGELIAGEIERATTSWTRKLLTRIGKNVEKSYNLFDNWCYDLAKREAVLCDIATCRSKCKKYWDKLDGRNINVNDQTKMFGQLLADLKNKTLPVVDVVDKLRNHARKSMSDDQSIFTRLMTSTPHHEGLLVLVGELKAAQHRIYQKTGSSYSEVHRAHYAALSNILTRCAELQMHNNSNSWIYAKAIQYFDALSAAVQAHTTISRTTTDSKREILASIDKILNPSSLIAQRRITN